MAFILFSDHPDVYRQASISWESKELKKEIDLILENSSIIPGCGTNYMVYIPTVSHLREIYRKALDVEPHILRQLTLWD